jgi:hypothetical protein
MQTKILNRNSLSIEIPLFNSNGRSVKLHNSNPMEESDKFQKAIRAFDEANGKDPNSETVNGVEYASELLYSQRMTKWLHKMNPHATEALKLAARCQHIERWIIPREDFPMNRSGYIRWRNKLKKYHATRAGEILNKLGYDKATIDSVQDLLMKKGLKSNPETQMLEDIICLVFLDYYFEDFAKKHKEEKLIRILKKTWRKMSEEGREMAKELEMSDSTRKLVEKAIA